MGSVNVIIEAKDFEKEELERATQALDGSSFNDGRVAVAALPFITDFAAEKVVETYHVFSEYAKFEGQAVGVSEKIILNWRIRLKCRTLTK